MPDRYDYYRCPGCERVWQQMDWNSATHQLTCDTRAEWDAATPEAVAVTARYVFTTRKDGFLCEDGIGREAFSYVAELHELLWRVTRTVSPGASGRLTEQFPGALQALEEAARKRLAGEPACDHVPCGACGCLVSDDGYCGCADNRAPKCGVCVYEHDEAGDSRLVRQCADCAAEEADAPPQTRVDRMDAEGVGEASPKRLVAAWRDLADVVEGEHPEMATTFRADADRAEAAIAARDAAEEEDDDAP